MTANKRPEGKSVRPWHPEKSSRPAFCSRQCARLTITTMCHFAAAVARQIARSRANGDIHAGVQDRTPQPVSHPGRHSDLRSPVIRNLARSVPIFAISRNGGNRNDSDHRIQERSLDFDGDPGLDACRLVRGRHGPGWIAVHSAGRRPPIDSRFALECSTRAA